MRRGDDRGVTLVELQVAAVIGILVMLLAVTAFIGTARVGAQVQESTQRFDAGMVATERLSAELRDAREVVSPAAVAPAPAAPTTTTAVTVWLDTNADYHRTGQPSELVTWSVDAAGRLCRQAGTATPFCTGVAGHRVDLAFTLARAGAAEPVREVQVRLAWNPDPATSPAAPRAADARTWTVDLENAR